MVKKRSSRGYTNKNFRQVRLQENLDAGALGADALISGELIPASDSAYRLSSLDVMSMWTDIAAVIDGGAAFGFALGDYTDTEMFEALTASASISRGDLIAIEKAGRKVRLVGNFPSSPSAAPDGGVNFNEGRRKKTKLNWMVPIGETVKLFIWNQSDTIWSTGSKLTCIGNANVFFT